MPWGTLIVKKRRGRRKSQNCDKCGKSVVAGEQIYSHSRGERKRKTYNYCKAYYEAMYIE